MLASPFMCSPQPRVAEQHVAADHRVVAAVGVIDAVLLAAARADVALEPDVLRERSEDPPGGVVVAVAVDHRGADDRLDVVAADGNARARGGGDGEPVEHDIVRLPQRDVVVRVADARGARLVHQHVALGHEGDRRVLLAGSLQAEAAVGAGCDVHGVARRDHIGGPLQRGEWLALRAGMRVVAARGRGHVVVGGRRYGRHQA